MNTRAERMEKKQMPRAIRTVSDIDNDSKNINENENIQSETESAKLKSSHNQEITLEHVYQVKQKLTKPNQTKPNQIHQNNKIKVHSQQVFERLERPARINWQMHE